jgi:deoxyribodipyrimidine photo-lyase
MAPAVPEVRIRSINDRPVRTDGDFVVYWCIAARRSKANFALQRAVELATELGRPLLVVEALRVRLPLGERPAARVRAAGHGGQRGGLRSGGGHLLAVRRADRGRWQGHAGGARQARLRGRDRRLPVLLPAAHDRGGGRTAARAARSGRRQRPLADARRRQGVWSRVRPAALPAEALPAHLGDFPIGDPLRNLKQAAAELPRGFAKHWPRASASLLVGDPAELAKLPIDHEVAAVELRGGAAAAGASLRTFLNTRLPRYDERSHPDADCASGLSPYLHFGHLSVHQVFAGLAKREEWTRSKIKPTTSGQRGWFGMSDAAEGFLDELVTWRELGYNYCWQRDDYEDYESLPDWPKATLHKHSTDPRQFVYSLEEFAQSQTHDPVWNAAQRQLRETGVMQNYLRMLWGKKVLEWTRTPQDAFAILIELNNRYALDGRNPNSYTGISWVFGRYDRPWAPERDVYGVIRYMSSANTVKKLKMKGYLARWGGER